MKSFGWLNIFFVILTIFSIAGVAFFGTIHKNFKDTASALNFFEKANVYVNVATIVQLQIEDRYPPLFKKNAILNSIADKAVTAIVSPSLVERLATPALKLSVKFAQAPTSIVNDKVVVATAKYKAQVKEAIANLGLPGLLTTNINYIIDFAPAQITLVDVQKHPNSPLVWIIKIRTLLQYNKIAMNISWAVLFLSLIVLFIHNLSNVKRLFLALWIAFIIGGLVLVFKSYAIPPFINLFLPQTDALAIAQNNLVLNAVAYLLSSVRVFGFIFSALGIILFVAWKFCDFSHFQKTIDERLKKVHMPEVEVKVK